MRKVVFVAAAIFLVSAVGIVPASAAHPPPIDGSLECAIGGSASFSPALTSTPSVKPVKVKGMKLNASVCDTSGMFGGKGTQLAIVPPITFSETLAKGAACSTGQLPVSKLSLAIKVYVNGKTKPLLDVVLKPKVTSFATSPSGVLEFTGTLPQNAKGTAPFGGEFFGAEILIGNTTDVVDCAGGTGSLGLITLRPGSSFRISPIGGLPCVPPVSTSLQETTDTAGNLWVVVVPSYSTQFCQPSGFISLSNFANGASGLPQQLCPSYLALGTSGPLFDSGIAGTGANSGHDLMGFPVVLAANVPDFTGGPDGGHCEPFTADYSGDVVFSPATALLSLPVVPVPCTVRVSTSLEEKSDAIGDLWVVVVPSAASDCQPSGGMTLLNFANGFDFNTQIRCLGLLASGMTVRSSTRRSREPASTAANISWASRLCCGITCRTSSTPPRVCRPARRIPPSTRATLRSVR